jgi:SAM-dependent methyltransferase
MDDADNIAGFYRRHARSWAQARGKSLMEAPWLDRFRALMPNTARVLDLGCGSGEPVADYLHERECMVTGVDASPEMIAMCKERFPGGDWRVADMRALPFGERFDGILAWDSFFHLRADDQRAMFAVFAGHAAPRAALMFTSGTEAGEAIGSFAGEPLYHASLAPEEYRALLASHGFDVAAYAANDPACGRHTIWLAQKR